MAKTLVIKGANFSANKLDTVVFIQTIPCTEIALNKSSTSLEYGASETLVATPTPLNTTDTIIWTSSDESVATVIDGVVAATGLGSATITVTCGNQSATCQVGVSAEMDGTNYVGYRLAGSAMYPNSGTGVGYLDPSTIRGAIAKDTSMEPGFLKEYSGNAYPYAIPNGCNKIQIFISSGSLSFYRLGFFSGKVGASGYPTACSLVVLKESSGMTPITGGVECEVPQEEGYPPIDSFIVSFTTTSASFTENDFSNISVKFVKAE